MYLESGNDYLLVTLKDICIICQSGLAIKSPNLKIKLLSYPDINKVAMMEESGMESDHIDDEIFNKCVLEILGFPGEKIDLEESPAGVVDHIVTKIKYNSNALILNLEETYNHLVSVSSIYDKMTLVVAYYTNNTYEYTQNLPVDELLKRYTACTLMFNAPPLIFEEEKESKVG